MQENRRRNQDDIRGNRVQTIIMKSGSMEQCIEDTNHELFLIEDGSGSASNITLQLNNLADSARTESNLTEIKLTGDRQS
jgi:hypothetical protein